MPPLDRRHGEGNDERARYPVGVNQYHPANVRAGCREGLDERNEEGRIVRGEFWKATAHGKGYLRACKFDGSVCGISSFEIDQ